MFVVLLIGAGEGCDYTIGCNKTWRLLRATTPEDARAETAALMREYNGDIRIDSATVLHVAETINFDCEAEYRRIDGEAAKAKADADRERRRQEFERLQAEFGS